MPMAEEDRQRRLNRLDRVFRPGAPVDRQDLFSGRGPQLASVMEAIRSVGQHAVIFGERGVGKTSLAATCSDIASKGGYIAIRINCDQSDNFASLWQKVIDEFPVILRDIDEDSKTAVSEATERATEVLNFDSVGPNQVRVALRHITALRPVVVFFDEFDQVCDPGALSLFSNTIKLLSDRIEEVTLVPVGVSDSVADLIAGHISIQRNLVQVRMPRMTRAELGSIFQNGLASLEITAADPARNFVQRVPRGLPQYAHMLGLEGSRQALLEGSDQVTIQHVVAGMHVGITKLDHSLASAFDAATYSPRPSNYADVLFASVLVEPDDDGYFAPSSIRAPFSAIVGQQRNIDHYNPNLVTLSTERGCILSRKGPERSRRYRFSDPLMEPYVLLKGLSNGRIDLDRMLPPEPDDDSTNELETLF
jgi:hypothetical protein